MCCCFVAVTVAITAAVTVIVVTVAANGAVTVTVVRVIAIVIVECSLPSVSF